MKSVTRHMRANASPKATVRVTPDKSVFTGETVTLKCEIEDQYSNWRYLWYKDTTGTSVFEGNIYTISSPSDQDKFWCRGERDGRPSSQYSDHVTLTVKASPKATVKVTPDKSVFTGETVTLKCEIEDQYSNWTYKWYKDTTGTSVFEGNIYTISSPSDQDKFRCRGERDGRPSYSQYSDHVTLTVKDSPKATVRVTPDKSVFTGETVDLTCEIDQYSDWRYLWYKDTTGTSVFEGNIYTIRSPSDQDEFWCRGERDGRPSSSQNSDHVTLSVKALPTVKVTVEPNTSPVFIGETVTLKCEIEDQDRSLKWRYQWSKATPFHSYTENRDSLTISRVTEYDQDRFSCSAVIHGRPQTSISSSVDLTVKALPRVTVKVPYSPVFTGETVTLKCEIEDQYRSLNWRYEWSKGTRRDTENRDSLTISRVTQSDQGQFSCRADIDGRPKTSQSSSVYLTVKALPRVTVKVTPDRSVFIGEKVTLKCEIEDQDRSLNWRYEWSKGTRRDTENRDSLTISRVTQSDQGQFSCRADIDGRPKTSQSSSVYLTVKALPRVTVKVTPDRSVFIGEKVTLTCEIEDQDRSINWRYEWSKGTRRDTENRDSLTISRVTQSDQGQFSCRADIDGRPKTSQSSSVYLTVKVLPTATVKVTPDRSVFIGEKVTLKCEIENQYRSLNWRYEWSKGTRRDTENRDSLTISRVTQSDQGQFSCRADIDGRPQTSQSSSVYLTVKALPRATVKVPYSPVFTGETVTLKCEIEDQYSDWRRYMWYKGTTGTSVFEGNIYTISPSDQDKFRCRGEKDGRPSSSQDSDYVTLSVKALPRATVRVTPDRTVLIGETVTLKCEIDQFRSLNWRYQWYKDTTAVLNFENYTVYGDSLTITGVTESDKDEFSCRAEIHGRPKTSLSSSEFHLTVNERPTPELSVWPPGHLYRGETVNLICVINRGGDISWQYSWYKDDSDIQHYEENYTIRSFNESHAGKYTCRGNETSGSRYSHISNAVTLTVSGSSGLIVGVVVGLSILFLIIFLVFLWWYKNKKGKVFKSPSAVSPQQNISQTSDQNQTEDGYTPLQSGDANIYDSVDATDNKDASSAVTQAGPSDAMYSQVNFKKNKLKSKDNESESADLTYADIELKPKKKMKKKKEKKGSTSEGDDTVYSKVKIGDKGVASGSVDVTYAQIK
ncbi:Fc receptor-like protein 5 [Paramisgurnus dabryanus]|uniref:Fc receptor-like protein 5 n=1 Tax=Paramisgurnus dabryanus TaxID=90735 RepID=UPI003CCF2616